jgi:hypothetical protein
MCSCTLKGEDLLCAPPHLVEEDFHLRARAQGIAINPGAPLDFKAVMPAGQVTRVDSFEWNYDHQLRSQGAAQPTSGRPLWDIHQNVLGSVPEHSFAPTLLPGSVLWSSTAQRPMIAEEHALLQGVVFSRCTQT